MKILILGAGATGLGAARRLADAGHRDWEIWEQDSIPGGLSRSITDEHGFVWDIGGHVLFSHYRTFDDLLDETLGDGGWIDHERESWIRILGTWVPYPFQYNIHRLPPAELLRCLKGLLKVMCVGGVPANFEELLRRSFGAGIADLFMLPYNFKVWAYPPRELSTHWIGERVALPDLDKIAESIVLNKDNVSWGPNNKFRFPLEGGTGAIWRALASGLPQERIHYNRRVAKIDPKKRIVTAETGEQSGYDALITTIPLDTLVGLGEGFEGLREPAGRLRYSTVHIAGVGLTGKPPAELEKKCWMYFPEANCPFYRVTVFSNYSPNNVPDIGRYWSLMAEVSESPAKPVEAAGVAESVVQGMLNAGLIEDRGQVHHVWTRRIEHGYPTPALGRDEALHQILPELEKMGIYSRGRFGAWKYEVANQDHCYMQGVEVANRLLNGSPELTIWFPTIVNQMHPVYGKDWL